MITTRVPLYFALGVDPLGPKPFRILQFSLSLPRLEVEVPAMFPDGYIRYFDYNESKLARKLADYVCTWCIPSIRRRTVTEVFYELHRKMNNLRVAKQMLEEAIAAERTERTSDTMSAFEKLFMQHIGKH